MMTILTSRSSGHAAELIVKPKIGKLKMEKQKSKLFIFVKYFLVLLVGLIIGGITGAKLGARGAIFARDVTAIASYSLYADMQLKNANYLDAKNALMNYIKLLDDSKGSKDPWISDAYLTFDKMLAYGRLSRLSQTNGNEKETKQFMTLAVEECKRTSWKDCSEAKVEEILTEMKRRSFLPDKQATKK